MHFAPLDLSTRDGALEGLNVLDDQLERISEERGAIGAIMSRLEVASNVLITSKENAAAAESQIRDADIAAEAAALTRLSILQQAASSVLAQANAQPSLALQLLR